MSTKIYEAWKIDVVDLYKFTKELHSYMADKVEERLKELAEAVTEQFIAEVYENKGWNRKYPTLDEFVEEMGQALRLRHATKQCYKASVKPSRDPVFCIDCGFDVFVYGIKAYIIPWGEYIYHENFHGYDEYPYWDNTDKPDSVSEEDWDIRRIDWDYIIDHWDTLRHNHTVVSVYGSSPSDSNPIGLLGLCKRLLPDHQYHIPAFGLKNAVDIDDSYFSCP